MNIRSPSLLKGIIPIQDFFLEIEKYCAHCAAMVSNLIKWTGPISRLYHILVKGMGQSVLGMEKRTPYCLKSSLGSISEKEILSLFSMILLFYIIIILPCFVDEHASIQNSTRTPMSFVCVYFMPYGKNQD